MSERGLLAQEGWAVRAAPGWHEDCGEHPCPPASNVYPLPAPLPRCHMGSGLRLGAPQQPSLGAENCPPPPADSVFPPQGTGCALALCPCPAEAAGRTSAVSQRWYLCVCARGSLWEGLGQDPLSGAPEGVQQSSGPRSAECVIFRSSRCVCVSAVGGGWQVLLM